MQHGPQTMHCSSSVEAKVHQSTPVNNTHLTVSQYNHVKHSQCRLYTLTDINAYDPHQHKEMRQTGQPQLKQ